MNANDGTNCGLQNRLQTFSRNSEGYVRIRQRFLECNNNNQSSSSHRIIRMGNAAAHEGDAVTDADIYLSGQRNDIDLFIDLYGVRPETAAEFGKAPVLPLFLPED